MRATATDNDCYLRPPPSRRGIARNARSYTTAMRIVGARHAGDRHR